MEDFEVEITKPQVGAKGANIVVIGVGGGGSNMLHLLKEQGLGDKVKLVAANTDAQALETADADTKILLGPNTTKGLGAGMNPELGRKAAIESYHEILKVLRV